MYSYVNSNNNIIKAVNKNIRIIKYYVDGR